MTCLALLDVIFVSLEPLSSFCLLLHFHLSLSGFCPSFSPTPLPFFCSPIPLQGGRQVTALGGRWACHAWLCPGLHQNMPSRVTPATAFPFFFLPPYCSLVEMATFLLCPVTLQWLPRKVTVTFNSSPVGVIHDSLSFAGLGFVCLYLTSRKSPNKSQYDRALCDSSTWRRLPQCSSLKQELLNVTGDKWILVHCSINIWLSFLEPSPQEEALPIPALLTGGSRVARRLINWLEQSIDHVFWET